MKTNPPVAVSGEDERQDLSSYALWLMDDQCKGILQMTDEQIAAMLQISRPSLYTRRKNPLTFTVGDVKRLEEHIRLIKAMLLTTEAQKEGLQQ